MVANDDPAKPFSRLVRLCGILSEYLLLLLLLLLINVKLKNICCISVSLILLLPGLLPPNSLIIMKNNEEKHQKAHPAWFMVIFSRSLIFLNTFSLSTLSPVKT